MIENVVIQNYKSIREVSLPLRRLNVLIGANGSGKSNFISFFEMTKSLYERRLGAYTLKRGGIDNLLYHSRKHSPFIYGLVDFDNTNAFYFKIAPVLSGTKGFIEETGDYFNATNAQGKQYRLWSHAIWDTGVEESGILTSAHYRLKYVKNYLQSFTVYHFHDTSLASKMRGPCDIGDNTFLRDDASNLAAYLYMLQNTDTKAFKMIEGVVRSVAPYFDRFDLKPDRNNTSLISLEWKEKGTDTYLNGLSFSDGTLRFIALAALLLQSNLPRVIIIDEPELGLHPVAIETFAAMVKRASLSAQVIISTQSSNLVNCFEPEDIIAVDRADGQTVFHRLNVEEMNVWMENYDYSISDLWEKNIIGWQI